MNPVATLIDRISKPTPAVIEALRMGPIAERLNRDSRLDVFHEGDGAMPSAQAGREPSLASRLGPPGDHPYRGDGQ